MRKLLLSSLVVLLLISALTLVLGQSDSSSADNACFTGGVMEGKCDLLTPEAREWAWMCGWYVARFYDGRLSADQVPSTCQNLIPGAPVAATLPMMLPSATATAMPSSTFAPTNTPTTIPTETNTPTQTLTALPL